MPPSTEQGIRKCGVRAGGPTEGIKLPTFSREREKIPNRFFRADRWPEIKGRETGWKGGWMNC